MKYNVDISPDAKKELNNYILGAMEFGSRLSISQLSYH